jgi:hypothetical protein
VIDLVGSRLATQHLVGASMADAVTVVRHFAALQAQDYPAAVWAIAQRTPALTRPDIDAVYQSGELIRTHVLRPTWHFVHRDDIRWMLELTAPRVHQQSGTQYRATGLVGAELVRGQELVVRFIEERGPLSRPELAQALNDAGFEAVSLRLIYVLMACELDRLTCSGGFRGKQHLYALFDDRVPPSPPRERDDAVRELAVRFLRGHGPATAADFANWSGLTLTDARRGFAAAGDELERVTLDDGLEYWSAGAPIVATAAERRARDIHLLPNYDEYFVGYKHRASISAEFVLPPAGDLFFRHIVLADGLVVGGWRNVSTTAEHTLEVRLAVPRTARIERGIEVAADWYGRVNGVAVRIEYPS